MEKRQVSGQVSGARRGVRRCDVVQQPDAVRDHSRAGDQNRQSDPVRVLFVSLSVALAALSGCASTETTRPASSAANPNTSSEAHAALPRTVVTADSTTDIPELFAQATERGQAKQYEPAARAFE